MREIIEAKIISRVRRKRNYGKVFVVLLIVFLLQFAAIEYLIFLNGQSDEEIRSDYIFILGAGVNGEEISLTLKSRLDAGLEYLRKYPDAKAVVTGGQGKHENITEAEAMRKYLVANGIDESRIIVEPLSDSTMENFKLSMDLVRQKTGKPVSEITFVTNDFHVLRAKMLARRNGLDAHAVSCETPRQVVVQMYLREYFALIKSFLVDR
ncbi:MAG: YdcF family protein [Bacillota bacterium]